MVSLVLGDLAFALLSFASLASGEGRDASSSSEVDGLGRPVDSSFLTRFLGVESVDGGCRFRDASGFWGEASSFLMTGSGSSFLTFAEVLAALAGWDAAAAARVALAMVLRSIQRQYE